MEPAEQLLAEMTSPDAEERPVSLIDAYKQAFEHDEPRIRMALGVYQDTWLRAHRDGSDTSPRLRQGLCARWLDTVLQPPALSGDRRQRLKTVLALAVGPGSLIVLKDVCGLSSAGASCRWPGAAAQVAGWSDAAPTRLMERGATVVTSNRTPEEWLTIMADPLLAQSAVDRLASTAHELIIEGESYRRRQKPSITSRAVGASVDEQKGDHHDHS